MRSICKHAGIPLLGTGNPKNKNTTECKCGLLTQKHNMFSDLFKGRLKFMTFDSIIIIDVSVGI